MKFLHISTGDNRGAFSGAYRLHRNLIDCGHESFMFVGNKTVDDPTIITPAKIFQNIRFILEKLFSQIAKRIFSHDIQTSRIFKANLGFVPTFDVVRKIRKIKPDLIIVYYVADFLSEKQLYRIQQITKVPVIYYLMDMGMLTGACHYAWDCTGYKSGCIDCPMTDSSIIKKIISSKWKSRKDYYDKIKPIIVSGSAQLSQQVEISGLTNLLDSKKIFMGVNPEIHSPVNRVAARRDFGFLDGDIVLYFGAQNIDDKRKGFSYLVEALGLLVSILSPGEIAKIRLFTIGQGNPIKQCNFPFRHVHLPFISDQSKFSRTYSAADVFICPSVEDSGPMMVNESMMSGTPVIAFDVGVAKDLVINGETGFSVPTANSKELANALSTFVKMNWDERLTMSKHCRNLAMKTCAMGTQVESFVKLADQLCIKR